MAYFLTAILFLLYFFLTDPASVDIYPAPFHKKVLMLALVVAITPIQTSSEEVLFRILPIRIVTGKTLGVSPLHRFWASLFSALLFALPNLGNRELAQAQSPSIVLGYYALFGFLVTYMSLESGGFEIALAVHAANNLFVALICNYQVSSLPSLPFREYAVLGTWTDLHSLCSRSSPVCMQVCVQLTAEPRSVNCLVLQSKCPVAP